MFLKSKTDILVNFTWLSIQPRLTGKYVYAKMLCA